MRVINPFNKQHRFILDMSLDEVKKFNRPTETENVPTVAQVASLSAQFEELHDGLIKMETRELLSGGQR